MLKNISLNALNMIKCLEFKALYVKIRSYIKYKQWGD